MSMSIFAALLRQEALEQEIDFGGIDGGDAEVQQITAGGEPACRAALPRAGRWTMPDGEKARSQPSFD
jgi:hypothetical protein